jgi:NADH-quinone oxidoreductase subunit I
MKVAYKPKRNLLETILHVEILQGMALTLRKLFSKPITRQYPDEKPPMYPGFRGKHALARDPVTGKSKCVACMRCAMVCPSRCIHIDFQEDEETRKRIVNRYEIEALRCVYCGYCAEVCPVNAILLTELFEYSAYDRESIYFDENTLLEHWDSFVAEKGIDPASYANPLWSPRGLAPTTLPAAKRHAVPEEWKPEKQPVGIQWKAGNLTPSVK